LAVVVVVVLLGLEVAALGSVAGGAGAGRFPSSLSIPRPHVGDEVRYTYQLVPRDEAAGAPAALQCSDHAMSLDGNKLLPVEPEPVPYLDFRMESPVMVQDASGQARAAYAAHVLQYGFDCGGNVVPGLDSMHYVDAATLEPLADVVGRVEQSAGPSGHYTMTSTAVRFASNPIWSSEAWWCTPFSVWQGTEVDVAAAQTLSPTCQFPIYSFSSPGGLAQGWGAIGVGGGLQLPMQADRTQTVDGHDVVVFRMAAGHPDDGAEVWLSPDFPYPLKYVIDEHWHQKNPARNYVLTIRLDGYKAGHVDLPAAGQTEGFPDAKLKPDSGLVFAPRKPWGLDESGTSANFPASAAWAKLTADRSYKDFVATRANATLYNAWFTESRTRDERPTLGPLNTTVRQWAFTVSNGAQELQATVAQTCTRQESVLPPAAQIGPFAPTDNVTYTVDSKVQAASGLPPPERVPRELPTAASLAAAFAKWAPGAAPNTWSFTTTSGGASSHNGVITVNSPAQTWTVGVATTTTTVRHAPGDPAGVQQPEMNVTRVERLLVYRDGGNSLEYRESQEYASPADGAPGITTGAGNHLVLAGGSAVAWKLPSAPAVAGASALALVAGVIVALLTGKGAKGAGLALLFSRVQPETAAEHPARRSLLSAIEASPGVHFKELQRRTAQSKSQAQHHLSKLLAAGLVREVRSGGYVCYFPAAIADRHLLAAAPILRADGARKVFAAALEHPGSNALGLAHFSGLQPSTVTYHVQKLAQAGLVATERGATGLRIAVTPLGQAAQKAGVA